MRNANVFSVGMNPPADCIKPDESGWGSPIHGASGNSQRGDLSPRIMRNITIFALALLLLAGVCGAQTAFPRTAGGKVTDTTNGLARTLDIMALSLDNGYVIFNLDEPTGVYSEGCRPTGTGSWMRLTYNYPSVPWDFTDFLLPRRL